MLVHVHYQILPKFIADIGVTGEENLPTREITPNDNPTQSTKEEIPLVMDDTQLPTKETLGGQMDNHSMKGGSDSVYMAMLVNTVQLQHRKYKLRKVTTFWKVIIVILYIMPSRYIATSIHASLTIYILPKISLLI